ncbi:MAG: hypothetical protein ACR2OI_07390 [Acidimicrobiia bacterium]
MAEFDPVGLLRVLVEHSIRFVLIGGVAARLRGAPLLTQDVDITPADDPENLRRLVGALEDLDARLRTTTDPEGVQFPIDPHLLASADAWTLVTRLGDLDLVFLPAGSRGFSDLVRGATEMSVSLDQPLIVSVASLSDVIRTKEAAGRDKDRAALPMLRRTQEEIDSGPNL